MQECPFLSSFRLVFLSDFGKIINAFKLGKAVCHAFFSLFALALYQNKTTFSKNAVSKQVSGKRFWKNGVP